MSDRKPTERVGVLGTGIGLRRPGPDRRAVIGSVVFHVVLVGVLVVSGTVFARRMPAFEVYRVKLVSPPPQLAGEPAPIRATPPVVRRPERTVQTPTQQQPKPRPVEQKPPPKEEPKPKEPEPTRGARPKPDSPGGEDIQLDMEGKEFPFPDYLENIILVLNRHFRWSGNPALEGEVAFYIERDGSVGDNSIQVTRKSGDFRFDLEMMSAVEQAGNRRAFGPLPDGWVSDKLWVRFKFLPPS